MNRCLICCELLDAGNDGYHPKCAQRLFGIRAAPKLAFTWDELNAMAEKTVRRSVTVPGVQPKLSLHLERTAMENTPVVFDGRPLHMEDMCQLTDRMTEEKYRGSMERVGKAILAFSSNPGFDAIRFFEVALFCFVTGNADMHLKNFSLLHEPDGMIRLSPAYDLLPTRLLIPQDKEEMALTMNGRKTSLHRKDFDAFAATMGLSERQMANTHERMRRSLGVANEVVSTSFLSKLMQHAFLELIGERSSRLWKP